MDRETIINDIKTAIEGLDNEDIADLAEQFGIMSYDEFIPLLRSGKVKEYLVQVKEIHIQDVYIEAETLEEALSLVADGGGIEKNSRYERTLDPDVWAVFEIK